MFFMESPCYYTPGARYFDFTQQDKKRGKTSSTGVRFVPCLFWDLGVACSGNVM